MLNVPFTVMNKRPESGRLQESRSLRRSSMGCELCPIVNSKAQFLLFCRYLESRRKSGWKIRFALAITTTVANCDTGFMKQQLPKTGDALNGK